VLLAAGAASRLALSWIRARGQRDRKDDAAGALNRIDEALALAAETGERWSDAFLHRLRGEILLKRDPANTVPVHTQKSVGAHTIGRW
jgi:hypothetical protein